MRNSWLIVMVLSSMGACIPPPVPPKAKVQVEISDTVHTNIEKTTVTVKDAQGNVMRIEEKEMVLQEYQAEAPVDLKMAKSPPVHVLKATVDAPSTGSGAGAP